MMGIIVGEANIIAGVPSMIVCGMEIAMYGTTMMVDAPSMIMSVTEVTYVECRHDLVGIINN